MPCSEPNVALNSDQPTILLSHGYGASPPPIARRHTARLLDRNPASVRDTLEQVIRLGS